MIPTGASILVVDDEIDTCRNLADILTDRGYRVDTAPDGPSALALARCRPYDIALVDLKMPGMDGLTFCRALRQLHGATAAIIVTAYASKAAAEEVLAAGAWQLVSKPVDVARLLATVEQLAAGAARQETER